MPTHGFLIGDLASATGTKAETIRYYERIKLLSSSERTTGNYRVYRTKDLNRLSFIRRARELGFSLNQVRGLLQLSDQRRHSCKALDAIAREHLQEVDHKIADLGILRQELNSIINQCDNGTVACCRIIEALSAEKGELVSLGHPASR